MTTYGQRVNTDYDVNMYKCITATTLFLAESISNPAMMGLKAVPEVFTAHTPPIPTALFKPIMGVVITPRRKYSSTHTHKNIVSYLAYIE